MDWEPIALVIVGIIIVVIVFVGTAYRVVPPYEAHVVVTRKKGRKVYCTREGKEYAGSAYWRLPFVQQRSIIPLENIQLTIDKIPLRDQNMAKFVGDVVSWLNINDPLLAAERIGSMTKKNIEDIKNDVVNVIRAITRNKSMAWTIIDILKNRKGFSIDVEKDCNTELQEWGMRLVELEVIHFTDEGGYTVIKDLEQRQSSVINADTRKLVATQEKEAVMVESTAQKERESLKAANEEEFKKRQTARDEAVGIREQERDMNIQMQRQLANEKTVESEKTLTVGRARFTKEATITEAEGKAEAARQAGKAEADVTRMKGEAEGEVIRARGFAEAESTDKRADALKKYTDAGISLEIINSIRIVEVQRATSWADAMKQAKVNVYAGGGTDTGGFFGLSPGTGFDAGAFTEIAKEHGLDLQKIAESIGKGSVVVLDADKVASAASKKKQEKK